MNTIKSVNKPFNCTIDDAGQRQKVRCAVKTGTMVELKKSFLFRLFNPYKILSATIIDISLTGIKAEYKVTTSWSRDFDKVSIVTPDANFSIENISCRIVSDLAVGQLNGDSFVRRCGIEFMYLSESKKLQLLSFIQAYAIDPNVPKAWYIEYK